MDKNNLNDQTDDLFKKRLATLSEEAPSEQQWLTMKERMKNEGLIGVKERPRGFIALLALLIVGSVTTTVYFVNKGTRNVEQRAAVETKKESLQPAGQSEKNENMVPRNEKAAEKNVARLPHSEVSKDKTEN